MDSKQANKNYLTDKVLQEGKHIQKMAQEREDRLCKTYQKKYGPGFWRLRFIQQEGRAPGENILL